MRSSTFFGHILPVLMLTACGGGGSGSDPSPAEVSASYVTFSGNAAGTQIGDSSGDFFQVRSSDRAVVTAGSNVALNGLIVGAGGELLQNGTSVGSVVLLNNQAGTKTAFFACLNGKSLDIVLSPSGPQVVCAAPTGPTGPTGTRDGIPATQCLSVQASGNSLVVRNSCSASVEYTFCATSSIGSNASGFSCSKGPSPGGNYGQGAASVAAGSSSGSLGGISVGNSVVLFGCAPGPSGVPPIPRLTQVTPPRGECL